MDQVDSIIQFLQDHPAYSRQKRINLCEICKYGNLIPRYILCLRNNELNSGLYVSCEDFAINEDSLKFDNKFRCRLCVHSVYLEKNNSCKGLFCTLTKHENEKPQWISEVKASSCTDFKFNPKI